LSDERPSVEIHFYGTNEPFFEEHELRPPDETNWCRADEVIGRHCLLTVYQ
jgi:hypothetical protein